MKPRDFDLEKAFLWSRFVSVGILICALSTSGCVVSKMSPVGGLSVSSSTLNFGNVPIGTESLLPLVLINNSTQGAAVQVSSVTASLSLVTPTIPPS